MENEQIAALPEHVRAALAWQSGNPEKFGFKEFHDIYSVRQWAELWLSVRNGGDICAHILSTFILTGK